jgi:glycosyltransferase involved in cell wall biosynthesis
VSAPATAKLLIVSTVAVTVRGFLAPYALHFRRLGWRVEAAANGVSGDTRLLEAFDAVHELPLSRSVTDLSGILRSFRTAKGILDLGFDIVHVHTPIAGFVVRAAAQRIPISRRPGVVYTAHGFHFHGQGRLLTNAAFLTLEKIAGRWTDRLVVINDDDAGAAIHHRIVRAGRLVVMPGIGVDTDRYSRAQVRAEDILRARNELHIDRSTPLFSVVGELNRNKRPIDIITALGLMTHQDAHLVLLGRGPDEARVRAEIVRLGLGDRVHMLGVVDDVRPYVAGSIALILASRREGLPRSIMEALSLEVPVIGSAARGTTQLVLPDSGVVVPIGDSVAMSAAMDRLIDHPGEAHAMGRQGRRKMIDRYDVGQVIRLHEELYAGLLTERAAMLSQRMPSR